MYIARRLLWIPSCHVVFGLCVLLSDYDGCCYLCRRVRWVAKCCFAEGECRLSDDRCHVALEYAHVMGWCIPAQDTSWRLMAWVLTCSEWSDSNYSHLACNGAGWLRWATLSTMKRRWFFGWGVEVWFDCFSNA